MRNKSKAAAAPELRAPLSLAARLRKARRIFVSGVYVGLGLGLIYAPGAVLALAIRLALWHGGLIPVALLLSLAVANRARLRKLAAKWRQARAGSGMYYGTRKEKLVEYLLTLEDSGESFSRERVMRDFYLTRDQFERLAKALDREGVFVRGSNNERLVRPFTPDELAGMLKSASEGFISGRNLFHVVPDRGDQFARVAALVTARRTPRHNFRVRAIR